MRNGNTRDFNFPDPRADEQLEAFFEYTEKQKRDYQTLLDLGFRAAARELILETAHQQRDRMYTIGRTTGMFAISEGLMSQASVADCLGYHKGTINNWVSQARENPEPDRDYSVDYLKIERKAHDDQQR